MRKNIARSGALARLLMILLVALGCAISVWHKGGAAQGAIKFLNVAALFVFAVVIICYLVHGAADQVVDAGDWLEVRRGRVVQKISFDDIAWVDFTLQNPPLVTLHLFHPGALGQHIPFIPVGDYWRILIDKQSAIVADMNRRIVARKDRDLKAAPAPFPAV